MASIMGGNYPGAGITLAGADIRLHRGPTSRATPGHRQREKPRHPVDRSLADRQVLYT
jgi:hypothetical protein